MKKLLISAVLGLTSVAVFGQGVVVMNSSAANAYLRYTNTVAGNFASGNSFYAGLYWAPDAATLASGGGTLVANGGTNGTGLAIFSTAAGGGFIQSATFGGNRTVGRSGVTTFFQLRAWSSAFQSYAAALASADTSVLITKLTGVGAPPIVSAVPSLDPPAPVPQILWAPGTANSAGALFVELVPVPEPSTIALVGLGLAGLYFIRRRK